MDKQEKVLTGYVHNGSKIGLGASTKYFDFTLHTEKEVIHGVCFSPGKRKVFDDAYMKKSPVKVRHVLPDNNKDSTNILMNDKVVVEEVDGITFERKQIIPDILNIAKLYNITPEQMIDLEAKAINLQKPGTVKMNTDNPLTKREGLLIDPSGSIKCILWEAHTQQVQDEHTYFFKNLRLKKNKLGGALYVNPENVFTNITPSEDFPPGTLHPPESSPYERLRSTVTGEVSAVNKAALNFCCVRCLKRLQTDKEKIVFCITCNMKQKCYRFKQLVC